MPDTVRTQEFKPFLIAWNLTKRCNLRCAHCYLDAGERTGHQNEEELTVEECFRVTDEICKVNPATMLVLTGGEAFLYPGFFKVAEYAAKRGLMVVLGTNGTYIDEGMVKELLKIGVAGAGISLDSIRPEAHDAFRGRTGSWEEAVAAMRACRAQGLPFNVHTSATNFNCQEIPELAAFAYKMGAQVFNVFFLVCVGRGEGFTDISPEQYEKVLTYLVEAQAQFPGMLVRAKNAPYFKRIAYQLNPSSPLTKAQGYEGGGCLAGTHYCRIGPDGIVTPCPFMELPVGNLREQSFVEIWNDSPVLRDFRAPKLKGKCGVCEFSELCGGCRCRAYALHGDYMAEDTWCTYTPQGGPTILPSVESPVQTGILWTDEATKRLDRIPYFLQKMVRQGVEKHAVEKGAGLVTTDMMDELRQKRFGTERPNFRMDWGPPR